jgi:hypothetical protein
LATALSTERFLMDEPINDEELKAIKDHFREKKSLRFIYPAFWT